MRLWLELLLLLTISAGLADAAPLKLNEPGARKKAPDFELKQGDGKTVRLSDFSGKVVLIDFWATWCGPCKSEIPWLNELSKKYEKDGLVILGISMDEDKWTVVKPFMEKMSIAYTILMGNKRVAYLYGDVDGLPVAFFVDRRGKVAAIHQGAAGRKPFEQAIQTLLETK